MRPRLAVLFLGSFVGAHAAEPVHVPTPGFSCTGMALSAKLPPQLSQLRTMGALNKREVVRTEQWDGYKATEVALHFNGLSLGIIEFSNDPNRYLLSSVRIYTSKWSLSPFQVGQSAAPAMDRLGVRVNTTNGAWRVAGESESLLILVKGGLIHEVVYECYTG